MHLNDTMHVSMCEVGIFPALRCRRIIGTRATPVQVDTRFCDCVLKNISVPSKIFSTYYFLVGAKKNFLAGTTIFV